MPEKEDEFNKMRRFLTVCRGCNSSESIFCERHKYKIFELSFATLCANCISFKSLAKNSLLRELK